MTLLSEVITWVRRIIKTSSAQVISDGTIQEYINRFYTNDMPARIQLFELKRQYSFETIPNIYEYQFPYDNYQLIQPPVYCDGVQIGFYQSNQQFYQIYPELVQNQIPLEGDGTVGPYNFTLPQVPFLRGFTDDLGNFQPRVFITATDTNGDLLYVVDDGEGVLNQVDSTFQTIIVPDVGLVNYVTGDVGCVFNNNIDAGSDIESQVVPYQAGTPRFCLFFNNIIKLFPVPSRQFNMLFDAYVTPAAFLISSESVPFAYMAEYIARGAARKILSDNGDESQIAFYEPFFREQENFVLRRTTRIQGSQRTPTIYNQTGGNGGYYNYNNLF